MTGEILRSKVVGPATVAKVLLVWSGVFAVLTTALACGSSSPTQSSATSTTSTQIHVEISDRFGDAISDLRVQKSPDIVLGVVDVVAGSVAFKLRLGSGTFDPVTTRFTIELDTDQDQSTGASGVEYYVFIFPAGGRGADVARTTNTSYTVVGTVPVGFVTDGCDVTVPLSLLGNDDGRFNLRVRVYAEPALPVVLDSMPDAGLARVQ
jgi:hypothetical protein